MSLTLWSSEATMLAGEEAAAKLRSDATSEQREEGLTVWAVERYEVVVSEPKTMGEPPQAADGGAHPPGLSSWIGPTTRKAP